MTSDKHQTLTPFLLITANVGSIFEDPSVMLKIWTEEFLNTVARLEPKFLALHCQEVGGKNYEESMKYVDDFVKLLMESEELRLFDKVRVYLDEDYSLAENFTALGNFYFIHESITDVLTWDFNEMCFVAVEGKEVFSGEIESVPTKEKSKFPQDFFPECKWSRKGFLRTRWNLNGTVFDLVNIHLFHDASNFVAMESFPSEYTMTRQRALAYTLDRFHNDKYGPAPFFLFGDFNFRTDTKSVIEELVEGLNEEKINNGKNFKVEYRNADSKPVLTLGKKQFLHTDHQNIFVSKHGWLKKYDREVDEFSDEIYEFPIKFPPSYPFVEDCKVSGDYMTTRCPAWCDRVLLSQTARPLLFTPDDTDEVGNSDGNKFIEYGLIGKGSCMGDHKPVYLRGGLVPGAGRLSCCDTWLVNMSSNNICSDSCVSSSDNIVEMVDAASYPLHAPHEGNGGSAVICKSLLHRKINEKSGDRFSAESQSNDGVKFSMGGEEDEDDQAPMNNSIQYLEEKQYKDDADDEVEEEINDRVTPVVGGSKLDRIEHRLLDRRLTERYLVKRVNSASVVEVRVGLLKRASCNQAWRTRSVSVAGTTPSSNSTVRHVSSKLKLISSIQRTGSRYNSHHSSSEEEWFEEEPLVSEPAIVPSNSVNVSEIPIQKEVKESSPETSSTDLSKQKKKRGSSKRKSNSLCIGSRSKSSSNTTKCCHIM